MKNIFYIIAATSMAIHHFAIAQNLLLNGDFSAGNSGFSTDYIFIASGQSQTPDTFGIRTNSLDFNSAYTLFGDHTTGAGLMALFDGYPAPDKIAWSETVGVSPDSDYRFSGWATSADPSNPGTLRISINGSPVVADLNLSTSAGTWTNFVAVWNSGTNHTATLSIVDLSTVSFGNDFALDDLSFASTRPVLAIRQTGADAFQLYWNSQTNVTYQLQWTSPLAASNNWQNLGASVVGNGLTNFLNDAPSTQETKFYRLEILP